MAQINNDQSTIANAQAVSVNPDCLEPFERIALAFSGGGFRAASYSLGVLSYLHNIKFRDFPSNKMTTLLSKVTYMSSASGGTIATTLYSLYQGQGKSFEEFYRKLYTELYGDTLLKRALENLSGSSAWKERKHKQRTLINAFALAYDECLFDGCTIEHMFQTRASNNHLEEVCFNTTELFRGLLFRQQVAVSDNETSTLPFGSYVINLDRKIAYKLKLGDVLAASSCFPGGFEPIMFPNDFAHEGASIETLKNGLHMHPQTDDKTVQEFIRKKTFGFMDGGITDNQGLESLMQADQRRHQKGSPFKPFSLMLVNDVASHYLNPYCEPAFDKSSFWNMFTLRGIKFLLSGISLTSIALLYAFHSRLSAPASQIVYSFCLVIGSFSALLLLLLFALQATFKGSVNPKSSFNLARTFSSGIVTTLLHFLNRTAFRILVHLAKERIRSMMMLVSDLFLKRIRYLLYESFYSSKQWENRGKGNHVYDLSFTNDLNRKQHPSIPPLPDEYNPSLAIQTVAQVAFTMGTTLWFDTDAQNQCH